MDKLQHIFMTYGISCTVLDTTEGVTFDIVRLLLSAGVRLRKLQLALPDVARNIGVHQIKISSDVADDGSVLLEIPRKIRHVVSFTDVITKLEWTYQDEFLIGVDTNKTPVTSNLSSLPHAIVGGTSGSGKSVWLHSVLTSLLWHNTPNQLKIALIDTKRLEMMLYQGCPHLYQEICVDVEQAHNMLSNLIVEMNDRYDLMANIGARNLQEYNKKATLVNKAYVKPQILLVVDEMADLILADRSLLDKLVILTQKARASGITCILATQRPDRTVLSGLLLSNLPTKIALRVGSAVDSRVILGTTGAEALLGKGDLLYVGNDSLTQRLQSTNITTEEIISVVEILKERYK